MATNSQEEMKQRRIQVMGEPLGLLYDSLYNEVVWIHFKWIEFIELYGKSDKRIEILNKSASWFFFLVEKAFLHDILLGLAKLTDPPQNRHQKNVSFRALPALVGDEEFKKKVQSYVDPILITTEFCRQWRHKVIAHKDYDYATRNEVSVSLEPATKKKLWAAIAEIQNLIQLFEEKYFDSQTMFDEESTSGFGAYALLLTLRDGLRFEEEKQKRIRAGDYSNLNFNDPV